MGRFSVEVELTNHEDAILARQGSLPPERLRRARISGVVATGTEQLVLPPQVVSALGLPESGEDTLRLADGRQETRPVVSGVQLEYLGRSGVFSAVVLPGRTDALIGASVLDELNLLVDCSRGRLVPRDPHGPVTETG